MSDPGRRDWSFWPSPSTATRSPSHRSRTSSGLTFAVGLDPNMTVAITYGVRGLPASFIIDRDGYLAAVALGPRTWDNAASQALVEDLSRQ